MTREETWQRLVELRVVKGDMPKGAWVLVEKNLRGANLSGANLCGANLSGTNLSGTNLRDSSLTGSDMGHIDLCRAVLIGADLRGVSLIGADLNHADMIGADLSWATLNEANLRGVNLRDADMRKSDLRNSDLFKSDMSGVDLRWANISSANLYEANLSRANLIEANLSNANLNGAILLDANLNRAVLSQAILTGSVFHGVSTSGWKIDGVTAKYMYFTANIENKKKYIRYFDKGKFEELYRSLPTIEIIFDQGLNPVELLKLNTVIEELKQQNPALGLNMSRMSIEQDAARVDIQTPKEENLEEACRVIREALKKAEEHGISVNNIMPQLQQLLPYHDAKSALAAFGDRKIEIQYNYSINLITGGGIITQAVGPQAIAQSITNKIFHQYAENKDTIDAQFNELKDELRESSNFQKEHLTALTDRLIEELRAGKDAGTAQKIWNEIKEGIKTGGSIAGVTSAAMALIKFFG